MVKIFKNHDHNAAVITIKRVKSFVNKVENQYVCEWNLTNDFTRFMIMTAE
jgi:hypothetical protein